MQKNHIMALVGGAVLFLLGLVIGLSAGGPSTKEIEAAVAKRIDAASTEQTARIDALEAQVATLSTDLGGRLDGLGGSFEAGTKAMGDASAHLGTQLADLGQSLTSALQTSAASSLESLQSGLAGLRGQISAAPAAAPSAASAPAAAAPVSAPADPGTPPEGLTPGQAAILSDGGLSVFISRVDDEASTAHVRANSTDLVLALGQPETVPGIGGDCQVTLDAIDRGHATVSSACGDALPAPDGALPGSMVALTDGLKVFVSGVSDDGARIAINGVTTRTVSVGDAVDVQVGDQSCRVSVENVDRGRVALGYVCG